MQKKLLIETNKRYFTGVQSAVYFKGSSPPRIKHAYATSRRHGL
jgi:hypothetical protein